MCAFIERVQRLNTSRVLLVLITLLFSITSTAQAQQNDLDIQSKKLAERVIGIKLPKDDPILLAVKNKIKAGDWEGAAYAATNHPQFYDVNVRQFASLMSTRNESRNEPLNDFIATVIGVVRDDKSAKDLLTANYFYRATPESLPADIATTFSTNRYFHGEVLGANNNHYATLDRFVSINRIKLKDTLVLASPQITGFEYRYQRLVTCPNITTAGVTNYKCEPARYTRADVTAGTVPESMQDQVKYVLDSQGKATFHCSVNAAGKAYDETKFNLMTTPEANCGGLNLPNCFPKYHCRALEVETTAQCTPGFSCPEINKPDPRDATKTIKRYLAFVPEVDNAYGSGANPDPGGLLTTRTFLQNHAVAGTNRRLVEYAFKSFMCVRMEDWADVNASDGRVGMDIDRMPGGSHSKYLTNCKGCHTGMDGFRGAFAFFDYRLGAYNKLTVPFQDDNNMNLLKAKEVKGADPTYSAAAKYNANSSVYPSGFKTLDNTFVNNSRGPTNSQLFGWGAQSDKGTGVNQFGAMIANSNRFTQCMAKRVFETVCRTHLNESQMSSFLQDNGNYLRENDYNLKKLFARIAADKICTGGQ